MLTERVAAHSVGSQRPLRWESAPVDAIRALSAPKRGRIGAAWRWRMQQEHAAVGHFCSLAQDLVTTGAEAVVLALVTRAASDEVRHFAICRDYAALFLDGALPERLATTTPRLPWSELPVRERALLEMVETCCISETLTGLYFTEMHARTTDPFARTLVESLLEDEIHHGRMGWTHLTNACREGWGAAVVEPRLVQLLDRGVGEVLRLSAERRERDDPAMEALGWLGNDAGAEVYREGLRDILLPGFDEIGLSTTAARTSARERGWLG